MLSFLLNAYSLVILLVVLASWLKLPPEHPLVRITSALTEPVLAPIRRVLPSVGGLDFSPMVLLLGVRLLCRLVA
jgi:YggT family protein